MKKLRFKQRKEQHGSRGSLFKVESTLLRWSAGLFNVFSVFSLSSRPGRPPKRTLALTTMTDGSRLLPHALLSPALLSQTGESNSVNFSWFFRINVSAQKQSELLLVVHVCQVKV